MSFRQWLLLTLAWMLMIGVSYLKGSIKANGHMTLIQSLGYWVWSQTFLTEKFEIVKLWQLKICFVWRWKVLKAIFGKVIPSGSSLSCSVSDLGLDFDAWPYQHFIQFQHQQFSLFKKTWRFFFFFFIEYFSGRLDWFLFGLSPPTGSNRETSKKNKELPASAAWPATQSRALGNKAP